MPSAVRPRRSARAPRSSSAEAWASWRGVAERSSMARCNDDSSASASPTAWAAAAASCRPGISCRASGGCGCGVAGDIGSACKEREADECRGVENVGAGRQTRGITVGEPGRRPIVIIEREGAQRQDPGKVAVDFGASRRKGLGRRGARPSATAWCRLGAWRCGRSLRASPRRRRLPLRTHPAAMSARHRRGWRGRRRAVRCAPTSARAAGSRPSASAMRP